MKTSELTGSILNWAVDKSLNLNTPYNSWGQKGRVPLYSTDWAQGGPIIEREKIEIKYLGYERPSCWGAIKFSPGSFDRKASIGPTPLTAAMRSYVASKLGDNVEVPDEVLRDAELDDLIYDRGDE